MNRSPPSPRPPRRPRRPPSPPNPRPPRRPRPSSPPSPRRPRRPPIIIRPRPDYRYRPIYVPSPVTRTIPIVYQVPAYRQSAVTPVPVILYPRSISTQILEVVVSPDSSPITSIIPYPASIRGITIRNTASDSCSIEISIQSGENTEFYKVSSSLNEIPYDIFPSMKIIDNQIITSAATLGYSPIACGAKQIIVKFDIQYS